MARPMLSKREKLQPKMFHLRPDQVSELERLAKKHSTNQSGICRYLFDCAFEYLKNEK